jgi:hypothetical protein
MDVPPYTASLKNDLVNSNAAAINILATTTDRPVTSPSG